MDLRVTRAALAEMRAHAVRAAPQECCGLLLGRGGTIDRARPAGNVAHDPLRFFEIDPRALIDAHRAARAGGSEVLGYYHSHPTGPAVPSETDRVMAAGDGLVWAIVGETDTTFWRDDEAGFARLSCVATGT